MKRRSTPARRRTIPYRRIAFAAPAILAGAFHASPPTQALQASADDALAITVTGRTREVIMSNKEASHFATDTHARDQRSYSGLYTAMHESLNDYVIMLDGVTLEPANAVSVDVLPWSMTRNYEAGAREEIAILDRAPVLTVRIHAGDTKPAQWTLTPIVDHRWIWETPFAQFEDEMIDGAFCIRRTGWAPPPNVPGWLAVKTSAPAAWTATGVRRSATHPRDAARNAMAKTNPYEPGMFAGAWPAGAEYVDVVFALGFSAEDAAALAARSLADRDAKLEARRARIRETIATNALAIEDPRLAKAYDWARASMDVLVMNVRGPGIYAGFHWFPNYWGRDTFICVPGALLVTGQHDEARAILRSFLQFQLLDRGSPRMGRLPNIVNPGELQYAGVDGTWWYVRAAYKYCKARR
ncbi:MAG: hypothetical protein HKN20_00590, partial [Gemmatimonadetes bacterium]|nr:hypothetical protein [Gemmatimonadota bacterium]